MSTPMPGGGHERRIDYPYRPGAMPPLFGDTSSVLLVDDDRTVLDVLDSMLSPEGYECTTAGNAEEAMARLTERDFAIAMVDILMPGDSGLELIERALDVSPFLGIVMVTGVDDPEIADLALRSGAYGYLIKPFTHNQALVAAANAGRRRCLEIESAVYRRRMEDLLEEQAADLDEALMQLKLLHRDAGGADTASG